MWLSNSREVGKEVTTLYFGDCRVVIKDLKKEIGPGLLDKYLKTLGLRQEDVR